MQATGNGPTALGT